MTVSVSAPGEAFDGSDTVRLILLPFELTGNVPPVQVPVGSVQLTLIAELKLMDFAVMFTVSVPPGGAHALPEAGGCKLKSSIDRVKGKEVCMGPLAISTVNG